MQRKINWNLKDESKNNIPKMKIKQNGKNNTKQIMMME